MFDAANVQNKIDITKKSNYLHRPLDLGNYSLKYAQYRLFFLKTPPIFPDKWGVKT